jgi:alginate O-acetyltransferase complex protein AlgI
VHLPYVITGLFLHQVVATPLTNILWFVQRTDVLSVAAFAFMFELFVYANFCGLSLIVFGVMGCLGARVPLNFKQPFSSTDLVFWRRWHRSLSAVLKELFYRPSRAVAGKTGAVFLVFLASGLWHGVTFNFMVWTLFHASCLLLTVQLLKWGAWRSAALLMYPAVLMGRVLFADADGARLMEKLSVRFSGFEVLGLLAGLPTVTKVAIVLGTLCVAAEAIFRKHPAFKSGTYRFHRRPAAQTLMLVLFLLFVSNSTGIDYAVYGQR